MSVGFIGLIPTVCDFTLTDAIHRLLYVPPKRPPFYFLSNDVKNVSILIIFGTLNPEKM